MGVQRDRRLGASRTAEVLAWIERTGSATERAKLARYAIPERNAVGIPVGRLRAKAKELGCDQQLAEELWRSGGYEARLLACFVADPARISRATMDAWARDFDGWSICDTACFHLFVRTPHARAKVDQWARRRPEFVKRAAFALLASLALHDRAGDDAWYADRIELAAAAANDERNFVKKGVSWALRGIGQRSTELLARCRARASELSESDDATERWIGRDVVRQLDTPASRARARRRSG